MNNLYTVLDTNKKVLARNVNYEDAAIAILTLDGSSYTIDHIRGLWSLFTKSVRGNYNYFNPIETSYKQDFYKAREEIFKKIIERACAHDGWRAVAIEIKSVV